ncbi:NEDD4-binding protein 2 [Poecilia reticulata]|uniref:NEDD4 binding protein 2 n=1 Tax=Poecilia reticulata TaxID=8081 RepID=A0A3P9NPC4_POERE|nr:PREDICTED: NEDD4-binding protein 2 [Poecilia reticulata]
MPRKKKNGQSPARQPNGPPEGGRPAGYPPPQRYDFHQSSAEKENILKRMQEMFSHLDPEVIHIVLSECDFKVENAMDSLLELSGAAEGLTPQLPPVSGFERTAAALLSPHHFSQPNPDGHPFGGTAHHSSSPPSANLLTEDLDLLIDQELETLTEQRDVKDEAPGSVSSSLPLFPPSPVPQQALPELLQSSMKAASKERFPTQPSLSGGQVEGRSGVSSPLNQLSTWGDEVLETQQDVLDFTHLTAESSTDKSKPPLDLAASGRPSAFQVYKKQETPKTAPEWTAPTYSDSLATGARSKASLLNSNPHGFGSSSWNLGAPAFCSQVQGSQRPAFITPVAQGPSCWLNPSRLASPWLNTGPISQSPLKPSAVPKSWALPVAPQSPTLHSRLQLQGKVLVLLRGAPGSGKSTLARALLERNPGGFVLSTDDYFSRGGRYRFDPMVLGEAHEWNHKRARESFERGINPIIIDNTNMQGWEMKPYVVQALKHGYKVLFKEPDTWWKSKPRELERRTTHNVPAETIRRMLNGYERFVTVQSIMSSHMPEFKPALLQENCHSLPVSADTPCPDLVDRSRLNEECKSSHPQLYSSLPDVSSISGSDDAGMPDEASCESTESLDLQLLGKQSSRPDAFDAEDIYSGQVDSELNPSKREGRIPDCIVESVMNEDHSDEVPVAFSESIAQRVKRERSKRSGFDQAEAVDLVKDTNSSDKDTSADEQAEEETVVGKGEEKRNSEMLHFVGDWPSEESLQQRPVKRGERRTATQGKEIGDDEKSKIVTSGPDITELQKLLDLIQTGVVTDQMCSSCSLSPSSGEEIEKQDEGGKVEEVNKTEERQQNRSKAGLPDCVQDWKTNDSHNSTGCFEGVESENKVNTNTERISDSSETGKELLESTDVCSDQVGNKDADLKENRRSQGAESIMKHVGEGPESPAPELSAEAESCGSSQEKKQRQGRRSGKQCKLALTFSHNSSMNDSDCSNSAAENTDNKKSTNSDAKVINFDLKPDLDLLSPSRPELPTAFASVEMSSFSQTEPQDFALLWRLNRRHGSDGAVVVASGHSGDIRVLEGNSSRFVPWLSSTAAAANSSSLMEVPYRVVHEKGTQLEEKELGVTQNRLESLRILSRHFKLVSFDTLEDLYDKCSQDLEWTTNLLLDSGERFFRDEDCDDIQPSSRALSEVSDTGECLEPVREGESKGEQTGAKETAQELTHETERGSNEGHKKTDIPFGGESVSVIVDEQSEPASDQEPVPQMEPPPPEAVELERGSDADLLVAEADFEDGAWGGSEDILNFETETTDDIASMDEINRLLQAELEEMEREQSQRKAERQSQHLNIQTVELKLSTELALQLTELFGPVGVDPGTCSADDFAVLMDLNLAKLLYQKWKETIQERQRQAALSFQLLEEKRTHPGSSLTSKNGDMPLAGQPDASARIPFMDHWNVSRPHVSLRDIIKEEQALQANMQKTRQSRVDLHRRDGASLLKEKQLYELFPTIDKHFLEDIFRDHNYSLTQTELFLRSLLNEEEPVKTVVAVEAPRSDQHRAASKEREKKQKLLESAVSNYQDTDDPEYEDFRAEANLQRRRQLENFAKAAEAFRQGRKEVASFYAQQGHLHGQRMREANHRAAVQIFERVNSSLLPRNILDLHGLHVNEALEHLAQVLQEKTAECEQGLCQPQLSVITGRGNHSQGGVARIRPAVIDYLTNKHYRFSEPKPGLVLVSLK